MLPALQHPPSTGKERRCWSRTARAAQCTCCSLQGPLHSHSRDLSQPQPPPSLPELTINLSIEAASSACLTPRPVAPTWGDEPVHPSEQGGDHANKLCWGTSSHPEHEPAAGHGLPFLPKPLSSFSLSRALSLLTPWVAFVVPQRGLDEACSKEILACYCTFSTISMCSLQWHWCGSSPPSHAWFKLTVTHIQRDHWHNLAGLKNAAPSRCFPASSMVVHHPPDCSASP